MKMIRKNNGSVLLIVVFAIALMSVLTIGIVEMHTEEVQLMQNQVNAAEALATASAGLNDALARIRQGNDPNIASTSFNGGSYTVTCSLPNITSEGITSQGFTARVRASVTIGTGSSPVVRIDNLRINE